MRNRRYRKYNNYDRRRVHQEQKLNEYHAKPLIERVGIKVRKGAKKYDEYLESLRNKGATLNKELKVTGRALGVELRKTKELVSEVGRPARRFVDKLRVGVDRTIGPTPRRVRYRPIPLFRL